MRFGREKWLERELEEWVEAGVISRGQATAVRKHRERTRGTSALSAFNLLAFFGAICVAMGVVLVVSYNWERIGRFYKIGVLFLILIVTAESVRRLDRQYRLGHTALQVFWLLLPLAGIGLMTQIYQLSGDSFRPLLTWLALGLPLVWLGRNSAAAFVHTAGIAIAVFFGTFDARSWITLNASFTGWEGSLPAFLGQYGLPLLAIVALWTLAFFQAFRLAGSYVPLASFLTLCAYIWALAVANTPFQVHSFSGALLVLSSLSAVYWGVMRFLPGDRRVMEEWGVLVTFCILYALTFAWHSPADGLGFLSQRCPTIFAAAIVLTGIGVAGSADFGRMCSSAGSGRALKGTILAGIPLSFLIAAEGFTGPASALANFAIVGFSLWLILEGIRMRISYRINLGVFMMGLIIVTRVIDYFRTLLLSGVAFIITGVGIIALAFALNYSRRRLLERAETEGR